MGIQGPNLPSTSELNRRFGPSFHKWVNDNLRSAFPGNTGAPTKAYMRLIMEYVEAQNWQEVLEDSDKPSASHNLHLVNVRMRAISNQSLVDTHEQDFMGYPPNGERIPYPTTPWDGVVHNPGMPGLGQVMLEISSTEFILILFEFNYIEPK